MNLRKFKSEVNEWKNKLEEVVDDITFFNLVEDFAKYLSRAIDVFPGPKHPARMCEGTGEI
mgnify:CR=1 FL=1